MGLSQHAAVNIGVNYSIVKVFILQKSIIV